MFRRFLARVLLRVFPETYWELHRVAVDPTRSVVVEMKPVNLQLGDYAKLLRSIADDLDQGAPMAVLLLRADEMLEYAADLQHLVIAHMQRARLRQ